MKRILYLLAMLCAFTGLQAQNKKVTKTGEISFEASVPAFEEVKAKSRNATFVLNTDTGEIASLVLVKSFRFKIALMEEHFNENYIESDRYPKATFKGKIDDFKMSSLTDAAKDYTIRGKLEIHGKTKDVVIPAKIKKVGNDIAIQSNFTVTVDDFGIEIPSVVSKKVSKNVAVSFDCTLK
ncbi:YceI family protein [Flavobacterium sp. CAU 1735]|uniref:YceI family protein n=1 Tax=Flavobacterium sp. CAU 1735 TaxID=3140361 RepID=UPI0032619A4B